MEANLCLLDSVMVQTCMGAVAVLPGGGFTLRVECVPRPAPASRNAAQQYQPRRLSHSRAPASSQRRRLRLPRETRPGDRTAGAGLEYRAAARTRACRRPGRERGEHPLGAPLRRLTAHTEHFDSPQGELASPGRGRVRPQVVTDEYSHRRKWHRPGARRCQYGCVIRV